MTDQITDLSKHAKSLIYPKRPSRNATRPPRAAPGCMRPARGPEATAPPAAGRSGCSHGRPALRRAAVDVLQQRQEHVHGEK